MTRAPADLATVMARLFPAFVANRQLPCFMDTEPFLGARSAGLEVDNVVDVHINPTRIWEASLTCESPFNIPELLDRHCEVMFNKQ